MTGRNFNRAAISKGSITVEASLVVPLSLFVTFAVLSICFYIHNRAWYTAAAAETAVTSSTTAVRRNEDVDIILTDKCETFQGQCGFPDYSSGLKASYKESVIEVSAEGKIDIWKGGGPLSLKVKEDQKVVRPVPFIRRIQSLKMLMEG